MIRNLTRRNVVSRDETYCVSMGSRMKGLMFCTPKKRKDFCLVLISPVLRRISLHMWFVFSSIDVIFANKEYEIVDLKRDFKPFSAYSSKTKACYAIELPAGTIPRNRAHVGDRLSFGTGAYPRVK